MEPLSSPAEAESLSFTGTFERDSVVWAFAQLAEHTITQLLAEPGARRAYDLWLQREPAAPEPSEAGLLLLDQELGGDGRLSIIARPTEGEFVLVVRHAAFQAVMATAHPQDEAASQQEAVCLAHFEGDPALAARWARALRAWLRKNPRAITDPDRRVH